jgi:hypothetical protein
VRPEADEVVATVTSFVLAAVVVPAATITGVSVLAAVEPTITGATLTSTVVTPVGISVPVFTTAGTSYVASRRVASR